MIRCVDCAHFNLRADANLAKQGLGGCATAPKDQYFSAQFLKLCNRFVADAPDVVAARVQWLKKGG